jgi:hypothetical protein
MLLAEQNPKASPARSLRLADGRTSLAQAQFETIYRVPRFKRPIHSVGRGMSAFRIALSSIDGHEQ